METGAAQGFVGKVTQENRDEMETGAAKGFVGKVTYAMILVLL